MTEEIETTQIDDTDNKPIHAIEVPKLLERGHTQMQVARMLGITQATVSYHAIRARGADKSLKEFKENRADIFDRLIKDILSTLSIEDIKRVSPQQRVWMIGVLYDKMRLERNKSTANVDIHSVIESLDQKRKEIEDRLKKLGVDLSVEL